jgi:hypothetical protein
MHHLGVTQVSVPHSDAWVKKASSLTSTFSMVTGVLCKETGASRNTPRGMYLGLPPTMLT